MATSIRNSTLRLMSGVLPGGIQDSLVRALSKPLTNQLSGKIADNFLQLLLGGMELTFCLSGSYRRNIKGFAATYTFKTRDGTVGCSAVFKEGKMAVDPQPRASHDVLVSFENPKSLWRFLLAEDQDILESILADEVDVDGNLNYIYKFGYLATDLQQRLGVA